MAAKTFLNTALTISLFLVVLSASATTHAKTIYVDDNAPGNNKGFTWTNAYNDLRDAITDARSSPKPVEIRVAQGIYKPKEGVFVLINGITLKGGYAGFEESDPEDRDINLYKTILSGDCNGDDVEVIDPMDLWSEPTRADNVCVVHSTNCNETAVLDGFIITAGRSLSGGGGMYNYNSSPTIINCTFSANTAGDDGLEGGGAIYSYYGNPVLINCEFIGNSAGDSCGGGGMYNDYSNPTLINCTFIANTAEYYGGGMINFWSNPILMDCTFTDNFSPDRGGGIHNDYGSFRPTLTDCTFLRNRSDVDGGAIYNFAQCSPKIANCTFKNNSAGENGGAIANCFGNSPRLMNCLFTANSAGQNGGAMYNRGYSPAAETKITGCTFVTNSATNGSAVACDSYEKKYPIHLLITSCIFWDGENGIWNNDNSTITITYSNIQSGWTGQGNIDIDPCFVEPGYWEPNGVWIDGDYHLIPDSPCINAGDPNYMAEPNETDLDGKPRVINGRIDMGAYEYQPRVIYVDDDAAGANNGSSWADAFNYLQDALIAAVNGDEIRVAQGIYKPDQGAGITQGDREATFQLKNGVTLKGGYAGAGTPDPNARDVELYETILSGDLNDDDGPNFTNNGENSYHVVTGSGTNETAILDGFTVSGGNANDYYPFPPVVGGGMWNYLGSPIVTNCVFKDNAARLYGGGMYNEQSSPTLFNCDFRCNAAEYSGSGMCNREGSNPTVTNCTFSYNIGLSYHDSLGVGMYNYESNPTVNNCAFIGNSGSIGAGMYNYYSNPSLTSCTFIGNTVHEGGGGMRNLESSPILINCTFSGNWSDWYGVGGMDNCCGSTPILTNCILWNDMPGEISGPVVITYSDVQGGWLGTGNIDADPLFISPGYLDTNDTPDNHWDDFWVEGDYHLLPDSPCIDAGDPNYIAEPNETDLEGNPRVIAGRIDMGAYEYNPPISAAVRIVPRTINLQSKGKWIAAYIQLPEDYNVAEIDPESILLEDEIKPEQFSVDEQSQVAIARFNREDVQSILDVGDIELTITGRLTDGTAFEAADKIKIINKVGKN